MPFLSKLKRKFKKGDVVEESSSSSPTPTPVSQVEPPKVTVSEVENAGETAVASSALVESPAEEEKKDPPTLPERLWNRAYDDLKAEESSIVEGYERVLSRPEGAALDAAPQNVIEQGRVGRQRQMQQLLKAGLKKTEKEAKIWAGAGTAVDFILSAKSIIDAAVEAMPAAAVAWTGVSIALQLFVNPVKATETNRNGLFHVVQRLDWYWNLATLLLQETSADSTGSRTELEKRVVSLYKELLLYQMKSVCYYYRNRGLAFLRTMVQLDDWTGDLSRVQKAEADLRQDSSDYRDQQQLQVLLRLEQLFISAKKQEAKALDAEPEPRPMMVPFGRNEDFVGREPVLKQLLEIIPPSAKQDDCQWTAIEGLGGVGKTQIALEAAFRVRDQNKDCSIFWVPAIDVNTFENAYREIGRLLEVEGLDDDKADVKLLVKTALSRSAEPWLLIVDNADDVELLFGTDGQDSLHDYLPFSRKGSILFTTRNHEAVVRLDIPPPRTIKLAEMTWTEAIRFMEKNLTADQMDDGEATVKLLNFLAYLPLAIKQASAYMAKTGITVTKYFAHCQSSDEALIKLLSKDFGDRARYKAMKNPITATWLISFNHISRDNPVAAEYLKYMSLVAEKDIQQKILPVDDDEFEADEAIATLKAYAFINERSGNESYDMHRLVRLAMRNWLTKEKELQSRITSVIRRLKTVFPSPDHTNKDVWMGYIPHAAAALHFGDVATDKEAVICLLDWLAKSYTYTGKYAAAETEYRRALELSTRIHGAEHTATLRLLSNLGGVHFDRGRPEESEPIWREVLDQRIKVLGQNHPDTLFSMDNLAIDLQFQGREREAGVLIQQVYDARLETLGADDPATLSTANKLAESIRRQGRHGEAEAISRQTLGAMQDILGPDHFDTVNVLRCLAITIADQGRCEEAEVLFRQMVESLTKTLGEVHPETLRGVLLLADTIRNQGRYDEAEKMLRSTLEVRKDLDGLESVSVIMALCRLARCVDKQGKDTEAEDLYRQVIDLREKVHGGEAYQTDEARTELALFLQGRERDVEAEEIFRDVFAFQEREYGLDDVRTLETLEFLASVIREQERFEEAEGLLRELVGHQERVFGVADPKTIETVDSLAHVVYRQGAWKEAEGLYRRVFEWRGKNYGMQDGRTLDTVDNIAYNIQKQGRCEEAEGLFRRLLGAREKVYGPNAQETLDTMEDLRDVLVLQGKEEEAATLGLADNVPVQTSVIPMRVET